MALIESQKIFITFWKMETISSEICIDFTKAFHTIDHETILLKNI